MAPQPHTHGIYCWALPFSSLTAGGAPYHRFPRVHRRSSSRGIHRGRSRRALASPVEEPIFEQSGFATHVVSRPASLFYVLDSSPLAVRHRHVSSGLQQPTSALGFISPPDIDQITTDHGRGPGACSPTQLPIGVGLLGRGSWSGLTPPFSRVISVHSPVSKGAKPPMRKGAKPHRHTRNWANTDKNLSLLDSRYGGGRFPLRTDLSAHPAWQFCGVVVPEG